MWISALGCLKTVYLVFKCALRRCSWHFTLNIYIWNWILFELPLFQSNCYFYSQSIWSWTTVENFIKNFTQLNLTRHLITLKGFEWRFGDRLPSALDGDGRCTHSPLGCRVAKTKFDGIELHHLNVGTQTVSEVVLLHCPALFVFDRPWVLSEKNEAASVQECTVYTGYIESGEQKKQEEAHGASMVWCIYKKKVLGGVWECSGENYIKKVFIYNFDQPELTGVQKSI